MKASVNKLRKTISPRITNLHMRLHIATFNKRMTGSDCAVMVNFINARTHILYTQNYYSTSVAANIMSENERFLETTNRSPYSK